MEWNESLATGIGVVDNQHKELINRINAFLTAGMQQKSRDAVGSTLNFVGDYVIKHFTDEQRLHQDSKYPKALQHKAVHDNFCVDFQKLKKRLDIEGPVLTVMLDANKLLVDWLVQHINGLDKEFASYYKSL